MYDIIIIGAGPVGLTSDLYARRANKKVLVLESKAYGGQIINASNIENYPGIENITGFDFATNLYNQVKKLNCEIKYEKVDKIDENLNVTTNKNKYKSKSIIIATGVMHRKLELENENKLIGKGISYCATCDGNFYKDKTVAVVGGGNTALIDAIYLSNIAKKVFLIHRRNDFRADYKYVEEIKLKNNVELILNHTITEIIGHNKLESIEITNQNNQTKELLNIDGLFVAIGQIPNNDFLKEIIELDENGYIISEDGVHTNINNVYVAGDTRIKELRQLSTATSDGAIAATTAIKEMED